MRIGSFVSLAIGLTLMVVATGDLIYPLALVLMLAGIEGLCGRN